MPEVESVFRPLPPQWRFLQSQAKIRGYGGAMGGGKSRCLCELALDLALQHEGIEVVVARQSHVSIIDSTKKIFMEQVVPYELIEHQLQSGGQDFVRLRNGSTVHFIGLDDPGKQFSREIGFVVIDEAHQVLEESVLLLRTRLRQRCRSCARAHAKECGHYPHGIALGFNPENPGHWLFRWFIEGATPTRWGFVKDAVFSTDGQRSMGDAEFVVAKAAENTYLPEHYIEEQLGGLPERMRRRYLDGEWLYTAGKLFFDADALADAQGLLEPPRWVCVGEGDPLDPQTTLRLRAVREGVAPWWVWEPPLRARDDPDDASRTLPAHRYVVSVDVSSGTANDYSAIQVLDVEAFAQVAEFQARLDMDELAVEAFRAAVVYNGALIAVETTGGWGFSANEKVKRLLAAYRGPQASKPKVYTRKIWEHLSRKYTDKTGWDTSVATRPMMLDLLEEVVRKAELGLRSSRCHTEMAGFVWPERKGSGPYDGVPRAQPGMNDDLVLALAIGVAVTLERPRELRRPVDRSRPPAFAKTGY